MEDLWTAHSIDADPGALLLDGCHDKQPLGACVRSATVSSACAFFSSLVVLLCDVLYLTE